MTKGRKILILITWLFLIIYIIISPIIISNKSDDIICDSIIVNIDKSTKEVYISENEVINILKNKEVKILGQTINNIPKIEIEHTLAENPLIKKADVYVSVTGDVKIDIKQSTAIMRIINYRNQNFYIDSDGDVMPTSKNYTAHVVVVTGKVTKPLEAESDTTENSVLIAGLYHIAKFISDDKLWNAQIEQIHVNNNKELELIPRVGNHKIYFGTTDNYEIKFRKLKALYEQGLAKEGWNKYKAINLKFKNQVVCTRI